MGDPTRLLNGEANAHERALLESLRAETPPAEARDGMWRAMAAQLGTAAVITGASTAVASSASATSVAPAVKTTGALLTKALAIKVALVVAVGAAGVGGTVVWRAREPAQVQPARVERAVRPMRVEPHEVCTEDCAPPVNAEPASVEPATPSRKPSHKRAPPIELDALREESLLIGQARAQLRAGELAAAADTLDSARRRFAHATLGQEREVLQIELLAAQGNREQAARRAQRFLRKHPESPHAESVQRYLP